MATPMRFREDNTHLAECAAKGEGWPDYWPKRGKFYAAAWRQWKAGLIVPAAPGDTWRIHWARSVGHTGPDVVAGYAIGCPKCREVHWWTTATNCSSRRPLPPVEYTDPTTGVMSMKPGGFTCDHMGKGSCWMWTGSAEANALTASPSLHCQASLGGCGWHGWLRDGMLSGA